MQGTIACVKMNLAPVTTSRRSAVGDLLGKSTPFGSLRVDASVTYHFRASLTICTQATAIASDRVRLLVALRDCPRSPRGHERVALRAALRCVQKLNATGRAA